MRTLCLFIFLLFMISSCKNDKELANEFKLSLRLERDPGQINPFYAPTSLGREVYQYIFTPLADFHPDNLELYPILIEDIPADKDTIIDGSQYVAYEVDLLDDAKWSDGRSLKARDYYFTVQMIKHPNSKISAWKPYFESLKWIELDDEDETRFTVFFDPDYMLSKEVALTGFVMPHHIYENSDLLIEKAIIDEQYSAMDSMEIDLVEKVNLSVNDKEDLVQLGPYRLIEAQTDEYIILEAKEDYWGESYPDNVFLQQNPDQIILRIVPDELAAINMAKESKLDFLRLKSSKMFLELKEDEAFAENWSFHLPQIMQYYFLAMNNKSEILGSKKMRKAISHLTDVDDIIQNIEGGLGTRTIGHFNPQKDYYNKDIVPIVYDPEEAKRLLTEEGWSDSDGDGVLDKIIGSGKEDLELELLITGSPLSQNIALLFQESAKKAGIKIDIVTKKTALMRKENLSIFNYDLAALAATSDASPDDPYSRWHSDNAIPGTRNQTGYSNSEADKLIEEIRKNRDPKKRKQAYLKLQELIHEDQPCVFLYSPMQKILISSRLEAKTTAKRPGYYANTFKLAG